MLFEIKKMNTSTPTPNTQRPTCSVPGCNKPAAHIVGKNNPRYPTYRRAEWIKNLHPDAEDIWCCGTCHGKNTARVHGVKSASHLTAKRQGKTITEYRNQNHPYLQFRKDFCENEDGRLGFKCSYVPPNTQELIDMGLEPTFKGYLQVDHIDGNPDNNSLDNLQTLCACCHTIKTYKHKDYSTMGRKTIKMLKDQGFFLTGKQNGN